jgi:hypothetical protein
MQLSGVYWCGMILLQMVLWKYANAIAVEYSTHSTCNDMNQSLTSISGALSGQCYLPRVAVGAGCESDSLEPNNGIAY